MAVKDPLENMSLEEKRERLVEIFGKMTRIPELSGDMPGLAKDLGLPPDATPEQMADALTKKL